MAIINGDDLPNALVGIVDPLGSIPDQDDTFNGFGGNDVINALDTNDTLNGGDGVDYLYAGAGDDTLNGGNDVDYLFASSGNDRLDGGAGNDELNSRTGDDILIGGTGDDEMSGGEDNDTYYVDSPGDVVIEDINDVIGGTADRVYFGGVHPSGTAFDIGGSGVEELILTGTSNLFAFGNDKDNLIVGNDGINSITSGVGDDRIAGGAGPDTLSSTTGNDFLKGGLGDDTLLGGDDDDILDGGEGDDTLSGGRGTDRLVGGDGLDELSGSEGDDVLGGGNGDDLLQGGNGRDRKFGGAGNDIFDYFSASHSVVGEQRDFIWEIEPGDKIDLSSPILTSSPLEFIGANNFTGVGQVRYASQAEGGAIVQVTLPGTIGGNDLIPDMEIEIGLADSGLNAANFIL